jgi:ribosomal protein S6
MSETTTRTYELGFLLVPTTPETEVAAKVDALKAAIAAVSGEVLSTGGPEYIDLAYQIVKSVASKNYRYDQAYFGWMKFTAEPEALAALKKALDGNTDLIRYILIKTTVENTIVFKKPKIEPKRGEIIDDSADESIDEELIDDVQEDHEKLPDVLADMTDSPVAATPEEKEEM